MKVRVLFFGMLKDLVGRDAESISLPEDAVLQDVLLHYTDRIPALGDFSRSIAMSINREYAGPDAGLKSGDEVALLPPVSGGAPADERVTITRERIETLAVLQNLKQPEDGGVVVFEGIVRDNTHGRRTLFLDYEAYEEMALRQMGELVQQALSQFAVRDAAIVHRLGRLEIAETSVLIVVVSAHRGPAFDACRWLIDNLKRSVPIWKKEYFEGGAVWADGEPFPEEVPRLQGTHSREAASKLSSR